MDPHDLEMSEKRMRGSFSVKKRANADGSVDSKHEYVNQMQKNMYNNINGTIPIAILKELLLCIVRGSLLLSIVHLVDGYCEKNERERQASEPGCLKKKQIRKGLEDRILSTKIRE